MSDLLGIGATGVRAYQTALTTVSENIANAGTAGFTRRSTDLEEVAATGGTTTQRITQGGSGVIASGITRSADAFRAADVRSAGSDLARSESGVAWLDRIDAALTGNQIGDRLTSFFNAATGVAADPSAITPRSAMLEAGSAAAAAFSASGKALDQIATDLDATADNAASTLDGLGQALVQINHAIGRTAPGTSAAAQLLDQRDQNLEAMSAITDVSATFDASGRASVALGAGGPTFVSGTDAGYVTYARGTGGVSFALHRDDQLSSIAPAGGALAGIADAAQRISDARDRLGTIAGEFATGVNAVQAQGRNLDGNAGAAMFATGATPTDLTLALADPRGIAAAAIGGGPRDNANLTALAAVRTSGGFEAGTTALVAGNGATLAATKQVAAAQGAIRDNAVAARDAVSGVSLDHEAVDLLRFQQAYQASSRVIQVARETFQSILEIR